MTETEHTPAEGPDEYVSNQDGSVKWPGFDLSTAERHLAELTASHPAWGSPLRAADGVRLALQLGEELSEAKAPLPAGRRAHSAVGTLRRGLAIAIEAAVSARGDSDEASLSPERRARLGRSFDQAAEMLYLGLYEFIVALREYIRFTQGDLANARVLAALDGHESRLRARQLVAETEGARDQARQAAGATGSTTLAAHFGEYASRERRAANVLRLGSVLSLIVITALAAVLLFRDGPEEVSTVKDIAKLSLTIPLAALAAYLAREATQHRSRAQWAEELEVQLLTVEAYTSPLSDELRDQVRSQLAGRVFGTPVGAAPHVVPELTPGAVSGAAELLRGVNDLVRSSQKQQP